MEAPQDVTGLVERTHVLNRVSRVAEKPTPVGDHVRRIFSQQVGEGVYQQLASKMKL